MLSETLQKLIEFIENSSPYVWKLLVKQTYIDGITQIIWAVGLIVVCYILYRVGKTCFAIHKEKGYMDDHEIGGTFVWGGAVVAGILSPFLLTTGVRMLLNPEYYAIMDIVKKLTGGN